MSEQNNIFLRASIDIGTNSCRLLITEVSKRENRINLEKILYRDLEIVKLGEDVNKNKFLKEEAIERTLKVLKKYKDIIENFKVKSEDIVCFATSATRDSTNRDYFIKRTEDEVGIEIKCISGEKEAYINFKGVMSAFSNVEKNILVFDIGGGSTEFTLGDKDGIKKIKSLDIGSVRITEKFFLKEKKYDYTEESINKSELWIKKNLEDLSEYKNESFMLIGVAGTTTTQISVRDKMEVYDTNRVHMSILNKNDVLKNLELFLDNIPNEKEIKGLDLKRRDVIIGGSIILKNILEYFNMEEVTVSEYDNLIGALLGGLND